MVNTRLVKMKLYIIFLEAVLGCFQLQGMQGIPADARLYHSAQKRQNQEPRFESGEMITAEDDTKEICILGGSTAVAVILSSSDYCVDGYPQYTYDACEDRDFIGINEAFTISPGERRCFDITIVDDSVVEYTEGFSVMLSNAVAKTSSGVINVYIVDNDYGPVLAPLPAYLKEDIGAVEVCVLGGTVTSTVPVVVDTAGCMYDDCEGSDYTRLSINVTISPGERRCFTIGIEDDTLAEGTEDFEIPFETAEPPHTYSKTSFLYIVDNDVPTLEFPSTVDEDIGSVEVCILGGAAAVPVVLSTADYCGYVDRASACEGNDYTGINVTVTISAGERRCITIDIVDDLIAERTERFRIELERYTQSGSPSSFPSTTHDIYIIDNDAPTLEMPFDPTFLYEYSEADVTVYEDTGSVDICVLGRAAAVPVLLGISDYYCGMEYSDSACGGSDYIFNNKSFTIQPGERRCFAITIVDDLIAEQTEDIEVLLQTAVTPNLLLHKIYFDIADNDGPMPLELPASRYVKLVSLTISEDKGAISVCLIGGVNTVPLTLSSICGTDFICINETFTISPGEKRCFNITIVDDSLVEGTEYFHVLLEGAGGEEYYYYWDLDIKDNDAPYLEQTSYTVGEGDGSVEVCVRNEGRVDLTVRAAIFTTDEAVDYVEMSKIFYIAYGEKKCFDISIVDNTVFEPQESFSVKVTSFADTVPNLHLSPTTITIKDDDGLIISLERATYTVTESYQYVEICIVGSSSDPNLTATGQAIISTQNSTAQDGRDYSGTVQMLTLSVGSRECINISIVDDETPEDSEVFQVVLTNSSDVDLGINLAQIQIEDDDIGTSPTVETSDSQTTVIGASIGGVVRGVIVGAVLTFIIVFAVCWYRRSKRRGREIATEQSLQLIGNEEPISGAEPQEA